MSSATMAAAEREDLLALAESLSPGQWTQPSLCAGWTVQDVLTHIVSYEGRSPKELARVAVAGRFSPARMNEVLVREARSRDRQEVLDRLRTFARPSGLTAGFGGRIALTDGLIHRQDIRRPLGLGCDVPADRLVSALSFSMFAAPIRGAWRARGVRVRAVDVDWAFGRGPEVTGPGEALLMACAGRSSALADLDGPGLDRVSTNLGVDHLA